MQRWLVCGTIVLCCALSGPVAAQVHVQIDEPGSKALPIAVSPFKSLSGRDGGAAGVEFADILSRVLPLSGIFKVITRDAYIEPPDPQTEETINFANWSVIGALALVKGSVSQEGDQLVVEARLFDVPQRLQLMGKRYRGGPGDIRRMANKFADEIMGQLNESRGPFNSRVAFLSTRGGRFKDLYTMSLDGGDVKRVTTANTLNFSPAWAPNAGSLLLSSYRTGSPDLFSIDLFSAKWTLFAAFPRHTLGGRWAPDGRSLAVTRETEGNTDIYLLNSDGTVRRQLTDHWAIDVSPAWSPDGSQIAFCSSRAGTPQIYVMDVRGGGLRRVTFEGSYNTSPSWSPKGDRIAYTARLSGRFQVFTVRVDGTDVRQVTRSSGDSEDPVWGPDGRYLIFSSTRAGRARLYVADAAGTSQVELTHGEGDDTSPTWSGWLD